MLDSRVVMAVRVWIWCSTLCMIYLPWRFVRRIRRERAVGDASLVPIFSVLANSHVWMLYGFLGRTWFPSFPVFLIGDVVSLGYLFVYWKYAENRRHVAKTIGVMFSWLAVPTLYVIVASCGLTGQTRIEIWRTQGLCFCDVTVVSIGVVMLKNLLLAFKQRSAINLVPKALAVGTFNTCGWFTFGRVTSNWVIAGPQVFVIALHVAAWTMYVVFTRRPKSGTTNIEQGSVVASVSVRGPAPTSPEKYQAMRSPLVPLHG